MLKDVDTGSTYERHTDGGVSTTIKVERSPLRGLAGKSLVTLRPLTVMVDDGRWEKVLGLALSLDGGTEIKIRTGALEKALEDIENQGDPTDVLVPVTVQDPYLPCVHVLLRRYVLMEDCEEVQPGTGPRRVDVIQYCNHRGEDLTKTNCRSCFLRWWRHRARELGIEESW